MKKDFLQENERVVFAYLVQHGESSVADIAKGTLINRTTLYPILERLGEEGLVRVLQSEKKRYSALKKHELASWKKRKEEEQEEAFEKFSTWTAGLAESSSSLVTEVKYYEGIDAVKNLYDETWRRNNEGVIYAITDYEKAYKTMAAFFRKEYFPMRIKKGIQVKSILPESKIGREERKRSKEYLREMRFLKVFEDLGIELNIFDDRVMLVAFDERKPTGVLIQNAILAKAFKQMFAYIWKSTCEEPEE